MNTMNTLIMTNMFKQARLKPCFNLSRGSRFLPLLHFRITRHALLFVLSHLYQNSDTMRGGEVYVFIGTIYSYYFVFLNFICLLFLNDC